MKYQKYIDFSMALAILICLILQGVSVSSTGISFNDETFSETSAEISFSTQTLEGVLSFTQSLPIDSLSLTEISSSTQTLESVWSFTQSLPSVSVSSTDISSSTQTLESVLATSTLISSSTQSVQGVLATSTLISSSTRSVQANSAESSSSTRPVQTLALNISATPTPQALAMNISATPTPQTLALNISATPTPQNLAMNMSATPTPQTLPMNISATPTPQANPCIPNRCSNNGTCTVNGSTGFSCICKLGYTGQLCESRETMYRFGPIQNDRELHDEQSLYYSYYHCLKIKTNKAGFPFFWKRHYKLYVCRNGIIQLDYEWSLWWPRRFGVYRWLRNMAIIAPFWAPVDMYWAFRRGHSKVYYHVYDKRGNDPAAQDVLDMASEHVRLYQEHNQFANFKAKWVVVVTWENLCPYTWYSYWYYDERFQFTCQLSNTFQAVIITNGVNTFLMYNYPYGHIQWVVPASSNYYWWYNYYGLPVAGWNSGNDGRNYKNIEGSGTLYGMFDIDKRKGNTGETGRYFWRIEDSIGKGAREACITWAEHQQDSGILNYYFAVMRKSRRFACPCSLWQAFFDRRFRIDWSSWPNYCAYSRRTFWTYLVINGVYMGVNLKQQCCYSTNWRSWGALKVGPHDGGYFTVDYPYHAEHFLEEFYTDSEAYRLCCVNSKLCDVFYYFRRSDDCSFYRPPRRRWFWGDPHFNTLDGKNYTFNGIGEYVMVDANDGFFQLQARTKLAQGNSTQATIFSAGAAQEENTSIVEVRVKEGGGIDVLINGTIYQNYTTLTNQSVEVGGDLFVSKPEENCLESSFPSTTSVKFCEKKGMLSFVVTPSDDFKNATKGLLGTWNDDPDDDFTLPDGTALNASLTLRQIHFEFGVKWQINASQSLFTYGQGENASTFSDLSFEPMFADNITWQNDSLRVKAEALCGDDHACLFDAASTNDVSIGLVTKDINVQLVNETDQLENFPPKIVYAPDVINATIGKTVEFNITAEDIDTIKFQVINNPAGATFNTTKYTLHFTWRVTSVDKINTTFVLTDEKGASTDWTPTIQLCACQNNGSCISPEEDDELNTDDSFLYFGCACQGGYTGRLCDSDIDACESNGQPCYEGVECIDLPPPADAENGYKCGPCPAGYTGDGAKCADINECDNATLQNCEQVCVNIPASFLCDCYSGYELNADRENCDDINECEPSNDCMQKCDNSVGSYNCSCNTYFEQDPGDWKQCLPTNPCSEGHGCSHVCFLGLNRSPTCTCYANYELESDGKSCKDIDECDPSKPLHRCDQICDNTPGSYKCSCLEGFELHNDGFRCEDINECISVNTYNCTDEFHRCVNTRGSYKCECDEGLYWIDGKCTGLEKGEKPPVPSLPNPREPSEEEKQEAVEISLSSQPPLTWDFETDKAFKDLMASVVSAYCNNNKAKCGLPEKRLVRRQVVLDLYTADQVHLMPGYPRNSSFFLLVAFYVQKPSGYVTDVEAISSSTLIEIITIYKSDLEAAIGANISNIQSLFGPTLAPSQKPTESDNDYWKWVVIGLSVGVVGIILLIVLVIWCSKKKQKQGRVSPTLLHRQPQSISMTDFKPASYRNIDADDMTW